MVMTELLQCQTERELITVTKMHNGVLTCNENTANAGIPTVEFNDKGHLALALKKEPKTRVYHAIFVTRTLRIHCTYIGDQLVVTGIDELD